MDRRTFVKAAISSPVAVSATSVNNILDRDISTNQGQSGIAIRFLGTGAADWNGKDERGEMRRLSSILIEKHIEQHQNTDNHQRDNADRGKKLKPD